jgi:hypothetical protein
MDEATMESTGARGMGNPAAENPDALLEACRTTREILGSAGHPHGIVCKPNTCKICDTRRGEHIDPYGVVLRIVWRDPTVLNDWHTAADLSDEMTHIVSVGIRTGQTPDTVFLTREVCADGELRGTNGIPKPLIVSQERLRALAEGDR